ncbi:ankyrin [Pandoraea fibrosis]|uniref:Ankyrin n=2 Tax=Pandoraea fibrosis TaxID=1891094 RepID=A0A5E4YJK8_9BURK|nr:ankyrin [Pandoraea fibrosis]
MPQSPVTAISPLSSTTSALYPTRSPGPEIHPLASTAALPSLSDMSLDQLLLAKRNEQCSSRDVWETLISTTTTAGKELLDSCRVASDGHPGGLAFTMATLFSTPPKERTLARLDEAGIFLDPIRRRNLRPDDAPILMSDEGLQLWLRFAASPSAYPSVFVDTILHEATPTEPEVSIASALKVLVVCGRDRTNDVPASEVPGSYHLPLSHLCSQVAPEWLPSILEYGSDPNQLTAHGIPLVATAMAAQAERLRLAGHDLLTPHASLHQLCAMLRSHGARLSQPDRTGSPPVMLLALNGYCAAAEALLSSGVDCNATAGNLNGNTLMHYLAAATHQARHAFSAFFLLTLTLRHGGDLDQPSFDGITARSLIPASLSQYLRLTQTMIASARERAGRRILDTSASRAKHPNSQLPPFVAAFATEANRLYSRGNDPLLPCESLFQLGMSLQSNGADLGRRHRDGTLPVMWLTRRGYCGAAEVLLALCPNANDPARDGNTLMHELAAATRVPECATLANYMLTVAMRYEGDPTRPNRSGVTALSLLSAEHSQFARAGLAMIATTRKRAIETVTQRRQSNAQPTDAPMRHSAAPL